MASLPGMQPAQASIDPSQNPATDSLVASLTQQEQQTQEQQQRHQQQEQQQQQQEVPQPHPEPQTQPPPQVRVVVQNVTASYSTLLKLDPSLIASKIKNAEYNAKKLPACVMRIREPQATGLLFQSGKLLVTGATGINAAHEAAGKFQKVLETLNLKPILGNSTVQNIVATAEMNYTINIELMAYVNERWCMYDPELFPGLIYQTPRRGVVAHVFCSGRVVLTGAKQEEHLNDALEHLIPVLEKFKDSRMGVIT